MGDRDRERDSVHLGERRAVLVLRIVAHREDSGLCLADALPLEEVGLEPGRAVDASLRERLRRATRLLTGDLDHAQPDALLEEHPHDL